MKQLTFGLIVVLVFLFWLPVDGEAKDGSRPGDSNRPNVLFILADDLGWSDTTLFGTTTFYKTPNIERLAKRGMTFSRAYSSSPLCSPTRSSILTGQSPARTGITAPTCHLPKVALDDSQGDASGPSSPSILPNSATRLKTEHYTLAEALRDQGYVTGHFGKWHLGSTPYSPLEHGFDIDVPHWPGPGPAGSYVAPWKFPDFDPDTPKEHIEDRMAKEAISFIQNAGDKPFFLNYWMFSVHAPFDAKQDLIDEYKKKVDPKNLQRSPTYAAMIESMDDAVGSLLDELDRLAIADNTIIVFASDNGGNMYNGVDGVPATNNAPLRGGKATMWEGGVRGPAIVVKPGTISPATKSDTIIQSSDFYPTLLEMLDISKKPGQIFDGISIAPALRGQSMPSRPIFTYFPHSPKIPAWLPPAVSVHQDDWKLIRLFFAGENGSHRYKLFHLKDDIGESDDLSERMPDRVKQMDALIDQFLLETKPALPKPNPRFDAAGYDLKKEGQAKLKISGAPKPKKPKPPGKPIAGWHPQADCRLQIHDGNLDVVSFGRDPHFVFDFKQPVTETKLTLHFSMRSDSSGNGQIFWCEKGVRPAHEAKRSVRFDVNHDGQYHDYRVEFSAAKPIVGIRLDPSRGQGKMTFSKLELHTRDGKVLKKWNF